MRPLRPFRPKRRGPSGCPECGGMLLYDRDTKTYTCTGCGRMFTREELDEARRRIFEEIRETMSAELEDEKEKMYKEYLKWYLSSKKE